MSVHRVTFRGRIQFGRPSLTRSFVAVVDAGLLEVPFVARIADTADERFVLDRRPNIHDVFHIRRALGRADQVVAFGPGALLDAAKLATLDTGRTIRRLLVPAGPEPWRAVTDFATVDALDGGRGSRSDESLREADVVISAALLRRLDPQVLAVHRLDSVVHASESLLSRRSQPMSRSLAEQAIRILTTKHSRADGFVAAFLAAEAFGSTKLGLAHAIASPLGARLGITHDTLNGVLGGVLFAFWRRSEVPQHAIEALQNTARLPPSLREMGVAWQDMKSVLPRAAMSSGIPYLPEPVGDAGLMRFARLAWEGSQARARAPVRT